MYRFNVHGWYIGETSDRDAYTTSSPPPAPSGNQQPNWTGKQWVLRIYSPPPAYIEPLKEYEWYIDIGSFMDRFGSAKMNILSSADNTVQAIVKNVQTRNWIDLQSTETSNGIDILISKGVVGIDAALKDAIINTKPTRAEQRSLIRLFLQSL